MHAISSLSLRLAATYPSQLKVTNQSSVGTFVQLPDEGGVKEYSWGAPGYLGCRRGGDLQKLQKLKKIDSGAYNVIQYGCIMES